MEKRIVFAHSADGTRVACSVEGSGLPLIMIHVPLFSHCGLPAAPEWAGFAQVMTQAQSFIKADLRGCGLADRHVGSHSLEGYIDDIVALFGALGISRADILALSLRCPLAIRFAAQHPSMVRRLILWGPTMGENATGGFKLTSRGFLDLAAQDWQATLETIASRTSGSEARVPELVRSMTASCEQSDLLGFYRCLETTDVRDDLPRIECPTLVGEVAGMTLRESGHVERVASLIPKSELTFLPHKENYMYVEDLARAILSWGNRLDSAGAAGASDQLAARTALTPRETEVLQLLASGLRNHEIAARLAVSPSTVDRHIQNIYAKAGVRNRAEATRWAIAQAVVPAALTT